MTRRLTLPHGLAGLQPDGTFWLVRPGELCHTVQCAWSGPPPWPEHDCRCKGQMQPPWSLLALAHGDDRIPCPDCRITLLGECPECHGAKCAYSCAIMPEPVQCVEYECFCWCRGAGTVTLGYAYAVSEVLPIIGPGFDGPEPNGPYIELRIIQPHMDGRHQWDAHVYARTTDGGRRMVPGSLIHSLAHYGDPATLVGQYALQLRKVEA